MASLAQPKTYEEVRVLLLYANFDHDAMRDARALGEACKGLGYQVTSIIEREQALEDRSYDSSETKPVLETLVRKWVEGHGQALFFVYFGGHGSVLTDRDDRDYLEGVWIDDDDSRRIKLDVTRAHEIVRDETGMDLLRISECCDADDDLFEPPVKSATHSVSRQIVESLAAGSGVIQLVNDGNDFSQRFTNELLSLRGKAEADRSVKSAFDRIEDRNIKQREGHYRRNQGESSITLPFFDHSMPLTEEDEDSSSAPEPSGEIEERERDAEDSVQEAGGVNDGAGES